MRNIEEKRRGRPGRFPLGLLLLLLLFAATAASGGEQIGDKTLQPCHLDGYWQEVLCGSHTVFEDRAAGEGRELEIRFAVMPAVGEKPLPDPVVVFAGGPGQAAMDMAPFIRRAFGDVLEERAVVLIDQRGMGESAALECELPDEEFEISPREAEELAKKEIRRCLGEWDADVTLYTQDLANDDIHEILVTLGYEKVNLYGASWGTRSALLYAHRYPEHARSMVLDGALPPQNTAPIFAAEDGDRALRALFDACAADAACSRAFPELEADYRRALERIGSDEVEIQITDPRTGDLEKAFLTAAHFGGMVRNVLYSPDLSRLLPWLIHRAAEGDYRAFAGVASYFDSTSGDTMTPGGMLAIFCAEELARADEEEASGETLIGRAMLDGLRGACSVWPEGQVPALYREEIRPDVPTLVLSGDVDPITPPRWGEAMAELLPRSRHLVAPQTGHNVSPVGCAPELIEEFIVAADASGLDASCLEEIERPSFFVGVAGPSMRPAGEGSER